MSEICYSCIVAPDGEATLIGLGWKALLSSLGNSVRDCLFTMDAISCNKQNKLTTENKNLILSKQAMWEAAVAGWDSDGLISDAFMGRDTKETKKSKEKGRGTREKQGNKSRPD
ncbi:hypothetical protein VNO77_04205 [Canavalia gladiata]|uniref:Uncharacterized protein n=1 Tax=Canavalia gladiata TaxID=3824 RepID=A0AAN9R4L7_CANGL